MKSLLLLLSLTVLLAVGCATQINTKDVTKITVTTTGLKIAQSPADKTPQLILGREQIEYLKVPTGVNNDGATNAAAPGAASDTANVVSSYEVNTKSPVFGHATMTTTFAVGSNAVQTKIGGQHDVINAGTGSNTTQPTPTPASNPLPVSPP